MAKKNRKLAFILASIMTAGAALSSCGNNADNGGGTASTGSGGDSAAPESAAIGVMMPHSGQLPPDTPVGQAWEEMMSEKLGCDITFEWNFIPWAEYQEKENVALASADFPDIIHVMNMSDTVPYEDQGLFIDLGQYEEMMPNYMAFVNTVQYGRDKVFNSDGQCYGFQNVEIPRMEEGVGIYNTTTYRYDIFEKHGIKIPETTAEFYEAAKQLKELYPDIYPVSRAGSRETGIFHTSDGIFWDGDEYVYGPVTTNYRDMLTWLHQLYAEELLDPESFTEDSNMHQTKALNGSNFMQLGQWYSDSYNWNLNEESDAFWVNALAPSDERYGVAWQDVWNVNEPVIQWEAAVINADSDYVDLCIQLCDLQYSDEVIELISWGIEGESFVYGEDGKPTLVDEIKNDEDPWGKANEWGMRASASTRPGLQCATDTAAYLDLAPNDPCYVNGELVEMPWELAFANEPWPESELIPPTVFEPPITWTTEEAQQNSNAMTAIQTYVDETKIKFIQGDEPLENWDIFVQTITDMGYQEVLDRYNAKAAEIVE